MASFGSSVQVRHGATCQKSMVPAPPVTIASFGAVLQQDQAMSARRDPI
jgi:hypothetical protein